MFAFSRSSSRAGGSEAHKGHDVHVPESLREGDVLIPGSPCSLDGQLDLLGFTNRSSFQTSAGGSPFHPVPELRLTCPTPEQVMANCDPDAIHGTISIDAVVMQSEHSLGSVAPAVSTRQTYEDDSVTAVHLEIKEENTQPVEKSWKRRSFGFQLARHTRREDDDRSSIRHRSSVWKRAGKLIINAKHATAKRFRQGQSAIWRQRAGMNPSSGL